MFSKADVVYDSAIISADEIRDSIRALGYPSQILDDTENGYSKIDLLVNFFYSNKHDQIYMFRSAE